MHQAQTEQSHQHRDDERRKAETLGHEEVCQQRTHGAAAVLELAGGVHPFVRLQVHHQTLVSLSRAEIGKERYEHVDRQQQKNEAEYEIEDIVLENSTKTHCFAKGSRFLLDRLFCHRENRLSLFVC